jgi:hypothetical protein
MLSVYLIEYLISLCVEMINCGPLHIRNLTASFQIIAFSYACKVLACIAHMHSISPLSLSTVKTSRYHGLLVFHFCGVSRYVCLPYKICLTFFFILCCHCPFKRKLPPDDTPSTPSDKMNMSARTDRNNKYID